MKYVNYRGTKTKGKKVRDWSELYNDENETVKNEIMNEQQLMESRLWEYIDGHSTGDEKTAIAQLIEANIEWRRKYKELLDIHQLMQASEIDEPSLRFTRNVMEEIAKYHVAPATKSYINKKIIWGIGIFFLVMIVGFLIYGISQVSWAADSGPSAIENQLNRIPTFEWSKFFSNTYTNIFMMINVVLGLMLLDMYLHRKKEQSKQKQA